MHIFSNICQMPSQAANNFFEPVQSASAKKPFRIYHLTSFNLKTCGSQASFRSFRLLLVRLYISHLAALALAVQSLQKLWQHLLAQVAQAALIGQRFQLQVYYADNALLVDYSTLQ